MSAKHMRPIWGPDEPLDETRDWPVVPKERQAAFFFAPKPEPETEGDTEPMTETVETQLMAFKVRVRKPGHKPLHCFEFHAASWMMAFEYAATKGVPVSISLAKQS